MTSNNLPRSQGLYDPSREHDACGVGCVVDLKGRKSHDIIQKALQILVNLFHRGACGCEKNTGDGAGILLQMPHGFFAEQAERLKFHLPAPNEYAVGMVFLPTDWAERQQCQAIFEQVVREEQQKVLGWRDVPTCNSALGPTAISAEPVSRQIFIRREDSGLKQLGDDGLAFDRKLFIIRKRVERAVAKSSLKQKGMFYIPSLSPKTVIYKGMLNSRQVLPYFADLQNPAMETALALVHSRFSTNTFPTWARAHPYRYICHNGEINTLRGNVNWMRARESMLHSPLFGEEMRKILPIIDESGSDSAMFDNALELLVLCGRSLPHAIMMMIPEPWAGDPTMSPEKRAFYEYHSCLMEPWDG
ncbi:MAG: glutamate synthase subunit alpha, partial [Gemmataceae bacterium]